MRDLFSQPAGAIDSRQMQLRRMLEDSAVSVSVGTLAETLGVSISTVERDVAALRTRGVQVQSERGRSGGLYITDPEGLSVNVEPGLSSTDFVGRNAELELLAKQMRAIPPDRVPVVAVAGESGIGKTYLLDRFAVICRANGFRMSRTDGHDRLTSPPFQTWIHTLQNIRKEQSSSELAGESLDGLLADLRGVRESTAPVPSLRQFDLFERVSDQFARIAADGMALLIDDLHFADASSIDLLEYIANSRDGARLIIVFTYEQGLVHRRSPVRRLLGRLVTYPNFTRLALGRFTRDDINSLVGKIHSGSPAYQLGELVYKRSEGNPLFAREIIRELTADEIGSAGNLLQIAENRMPEGLRDAATRRLEQCSEECVDLLGTAATIGRRFNLHELQAIAGSDNFTALIDEAVRHAIVEIYEKDDFGRFSHGLILDALLQDLSLKDRIRFNSLVGLRRERVFGDQAPQHATEIAQYMVSAASIVGAEKAIKYSVLAGEQCLSGFSFSEAEDHFRNAVDLSSDQVPGDLAWRAELGLGKALGATLPRARKHEAVRLLTGLVDARLSTGDIDGAAAAALTDIVPVGTGVAIPTDISTLTEKVVYQVKPGSTEQGYLLVALAHALAVERGQLADSRAAANKALGIAEANGDDVLKVRARRTILAVEIYSGTLGDESPLRSLLRDSMQIGDIVTELRVRFYLSSLLCISADSRAHAEVRAFRERAERFGESGSMQQALGMTAGLLFRQGEFEKAVGTSQINLSRTAPSTWALSPIYAVSAVTGWPYSGGDLGKAVLSGTDLPLSVRVQVATALLMTGQDGQDAALLDAAADLAHEFMEAASSTNPTHPYRLSALRLAGLVGIERNDQASVTASYRALVDSPDLTHLADGIHQGRFLWRLATFLGNTDAAEMHLSQALASARNAGYRSQLSETLYDQACLELDRGRPDTATGLLTEARELAEGLGMSVLLPRLERLERLCEAAIESKNRLPGGLTRREYEVLNLVANGQRNREIATELVLSERTVQRHIANIYEKIGARNRAEATAFALRELAN